MFSVGLFRVCVVAILIGSLSFLLSLVLLGFCCFVDCLGLVVVRFYSILGFVWCTLFRFQFVLVHFWIGWVLLG